MSSPGVMHARKFEPIEWRLLGPREAQAYPVTYEEARRRVLSELLSMPAAPPRESEPTPVTVPRDFITENPDSVWRCAPLGDCAYKCAPIERDPAGGKQQELKEFCYVSSFERLTSRKPKANQPAPVPIGVHLRNVFAVTLALSVGALVFGSVGGGFPGLSAGVRSFLGAQAAKVRLILPGHEVGMLPAPPAPTHPPTAKEASIGQAQLTKAGSSEWLLYSTASIAFTPLK